MFAIRSSDILSGGKEKIGRDDQHLRQFFHRILLLLLLHQCASSSGREVSGVIGQPVSIFLHLSPLQSQLIWSLKLELLEKTRHHLSTSLRWESHVTWPLPPLATPPTSFSGTRTSLEAPYTGRLCVCVCVVHCVQSIVTTFRLELEHLWKPHLQVSLPPTFIKITQQSYVCSTQ